MNPMIMRMARRLLQPIVNRYIAGLSPTWKVIASIAVAFVFWGLISVTRSGAF